MKYDSNNLVIETMDEFIDRMIELHPNEKDLWEIRRQESKAAKQYNEDHPAPEGYVNGFAGWSV